MTEIQLSGLTAEGLRKAIRAASRSDEVVTVMDGPEPLVRLASVTAEMARRRDFFMFYPHDVAECFASCWRHDGSAEKEAAAAVEEQPALAG